MMAGVQNENESGVQACFNQRLRSVAITVMRVVAAIASLRVVNPFCRVLNAHPLTKERSLSSARNYKVELHRSA